ncbi:cob(I)yrinic acid a,c-diamide adenosyltransferase [Natronosalvus amylolyticus]|uniref:cob(I)yrinic acid a,c-diamide adenosyltransferase n=1 Tax=Natronosalvus amylolyticus TaxID=2961994 RepID=UPI0020C9E68D|nr:cob(I)yrinic acid a,c-diamide adenosyltransferase [Natronosalvus amylolyticus]
MEDRTNVDDTNESPSDGSAGGDESGYQSRDATLERTPGKGETPEAQPITPAAPEEFGLVQVWWGDGKGKTTAAMGMGLRAAGNGYRVHMLQFMKGGASSVEAVRGEYNTIAALPGFSYENLGHYGWHGMADGSDEADHERQAQVGLDRARELLSAAADADLTEPLALERDADDGVHMLILDEILYAADMGLLEPADVLSVIDEKPDDMELVLTGSHAEPTYLLEVADLVTKVTKQRHPIDAGQRARRGTEY